MEWFIADLIPKLNEYTGVLEFVLDVHPMGMRRISFFALQFSMEYVELQKGNFD